MRFIFFKNKLISSFLFSLVLSEANFAEVHAQKAPLQGSMEEFGHSMDWIKEGLDGETLKRLSGRAEARYYITQGGSIQEYKDDIMGLLDTASVFLPEEIDSHVKSINIVGSAIVKSLEAYGRYKASSILQALNANELIVEEATKSYEKIRQINLKIKGLLAYKPEDLSMGSARDLFSWKLVKNLNVLMDSLYITDFKASRGNALDEAMEQLKLEKDKFNQYVATLKIKVLENKLMDIHKKEHKAEYIVAMKRNLNTLQNAQKLLDESLKDADSLIFEDPHMHQELSEKFESDKKIIVAQITALSGEIATYEKLSDNPLENKNLQDEKRKAIEDIADLKSTLSPGESAESAEEIEELKERITKLENIVHAKK